MAEITPEDVLARIEASSRIIAASTRSMDANLTALRWLQGFALVMIGLTLVGLGFLTWHMIAHREESAALMRAVLTNTQTIEAQTRALLEGRPLR